MLLRSITKHIKEQNWTAVSLDFVIVVIGVVIGIQVANWNEARVASEERAEQLVGLHAEFVYNTSLFEAYISRLNQQADDIASLRRIIAEPEIEIEIEFNAEDVNRMLMSVVSIPALAVNKTTLEEIKRSGGFRHLSAFGLRKRLVNWNIAYQRLLRSERDTIEQRDFNFIPYLMSDFSMGAIGQYYFAMGDDLPAGPFQNTAEMIVGNRQLDNLLVLRVGTLSVCALYAEQLLQETNKILAQLEAEGFRS
jgi:hypothetical protein